jgi:uncharacterized repeat protein (TIGR03837 family)
MKAPPSCDIFCTVIDNYGDIGVSWRLARQLAVEYGVVVRLWVDKLAALQRIWPPVDATQAIQHIPLQSIPLQHGAKVEVREWTSTWSPVEPAAVVIEAFGCQLPPEYVRAMAGRVPRSLWINLEYLSAEDWVAGCHGLSSPQSVPDPSAQSSAHLSQHPGSELAKYFFFPGFTADTGGLLRERDLLQRRQAFQENPEAATRFLADCGLGELAEEVRGATARLLVSLFAYEGAPLPDLFETWSKSSRPIICLVPEGRLLGAIGRFFGGARPDAGAVLRRGALTVAVLPFLPQDDYDRLLWGCDLNFVRGEDSFARAQWAGRPFAWHIYPQAEAAHWPKLDAFLDLYRASLPSAEARALGDFWHAWNGRGDIAASWHELALQLPALRASAEEWSSQLARQGNLAAALVQFCANHV